MAARDHLEVGLRLYDPQQHRDHAVRYGADPGVVCGGYLGWVLWALLTRPCSTTTGRLPWPGKWPIPILCKSP